MVEEFLNLTNITSTNSNNTDFVNITDADVLRFNQNFVVISVYSALFVIAAVGNLTVFISLFRSRHRKSRISLMIRHLAIADLIVTFIMIPIEVGWRLTGKWIAGNVACKVFQFLRAFGPYLSSNVLVCVSLDRYFAVLHPLKVNDARRRGKVMLAFAWGTSFIYCIPQSFVFRVIEHPHIPNFLQCVSFEFFQTPAQEIAYNLACVMCMYFIPLFVIIVAYTAIMCEISKNSKSTTKGESHHSSNGRMRLRRSAISNIERARTRTLRMTITIVAVYIWCCTPYVIITLWYMFDREGARQLPQWLQDTFFIMVVSNSCMNPIVYGSYVINFRRMRCGCLSSKNDTELNRGNGETQMAAGRGTSIARGVIKCVLRMQKVGSGTTKSTATVHGLVCGNGGNTKRSVLKRTHNDNIAEDHPTPSSSDRRCNNNNGHISCYNESRRRRNCRLSFHSEPCARTATYSDDHHSLEDGLCHSADYTKQFASDVL